MKKHELELDYLAPFLAQIGDPPHISRQEAYKLKEECLQDLKHRLIDKANLIQARFEKVCDTSDQQRVILKSCTDLLNSRGNSIRMNASRASLVKSWHNSRMSRKLQ